MEPYFEVTNPRSPDYTRHDIPYSNTTGRPVTNVELQSTNIKIVTFSPTAVTIDAKSDIGSAGAAKVTEAFKFTLSSPSGSRSASLNVGVKQTLWHIGTLATDNYEWDVSVTESMQTSLQSSIVNAFPNITMVQAETAAATIVAAIKTGNFNASLSASASGIFSQTGNKDNTSQTYGATGTVEIIIGTIGWVQISIQGSITALWTVAATNTATVTGTAGLKLGTITDNKIPLSIYGITLGIISVLDSDPNVNGRGNATTLGITVNIRF